MRSYGQSIDQTAQSIERLPFDLAKITVLNLALSQRSSVRPTIKPSIRTLEIVLLFDLLVKRLSRFVAFEIISKLFLK